MRVRYIRDTIKGTKQGGGNSWLRIHALNKAGVDVAEGAPFAFTSNLLDWKVGSITTPGEERLEEEGETSVIIDLGRIYEVEIIVVKHGVEGDVFQGSKLEISTNVSHWKEVFNSERSGVYIERARGKSHYLGENK